MLFFYFMRMCVWRITRDFSCIAFSRALSKALSTVPLLSKCASRRLRREFLERFLCVYRVFFFVLSIVPLLSKCASRRLRMCAGRITMNFFRICNTSVAYKRASTDSSWSFPRRKAANSSLSPASHLFFLNKKN